MNCVAQQRLELGSPKFQDKLLSTTPAQMSYLHHVVGSFILGTNDFPSLIAAFYDLPNMPLISHRKICKRVLSEKVINLNHLRKMVETISGPVGD